MCFFCYIQWKFKKVNLYSLDSFTAVMYQEKGGKIKFPLFLNPGSFLVVLSLGRSIYLGETPFSMDVVLVLHPLDARNFLSNKTRIQK